VDGLRDTSLTCPIPSISGRYPRSHAAFLHLLLTHETDSLLTLQEHGDDRPDTRGVLRGVPDAHPRVILAGSSVRHPVQVVPDRPVIPREHPCRLGALDPATADVVSPLDDRLPVAVHLIGPHRDTIPGCRRRELRPCPGAETQAGTQGMTGPGTRLASEGAMSRPGLGRSQRAVMEGPPFWSSASCRMSSDMEEGVEVVAACVLRAARPAEWEQARAHFLACARAA